MLWLPPWRDELRRSSGSDEEQCITPTKLAIRNATPHKLDALCSGARPKGTAGSPGTLKATPVPAQAAKPDTDTAPSRHRGASSPPRAQPAASRLKHVSPKLARNGAEYQATLKGVQEMAQAMAALQAAAEAQVMQAELQKRQLFFENVSALAAVFGLQASCDMTDDGAHRSCRPHVVHLQDVNLGFLARAGVSPLVVTNARARRVECHPTDTTLAESFLGPYQRQLWAFDPLALWSSTAREFGSNDGACCSCRSHAMFAAVLMSCHASQRRCTRLCSSAVES